MLALLKYLQLPWEAARGYLLEDLERIESALNTRWAATFGANNELQASTIPGTSTALTRYVANTGAGFTPNWDQVNLANGVKGRLPFANLVAATTGSVLVGRDASGAGDFEEITLGPSELMDGTQHYDIGGTVAMYKFCGGL